MRSSTAAAGEVLIVCLTLVTGSVADTNNTEVEFLLGDASGGWISPALTYAAESHADSEIIHDKNFATAQMLSPQRNLGLRTAQRPQRTQETSNRESGLASVPFMIGDTTAGTCVSYGGITDIALGHPTLGCSRLNISESNTPLPTDRVYFSYRHFRNASETLVFANPGNFNIDRFTLAGERTFFDGMMSAEIRLPLEYRLTSELSTNIVMFDPPSIAGFQPGIDPLIGGRRTELANMSLIFKALLVERQTYAVSAGLGVTLPTAQDVHYDATVDTFVTDGVDVLLNVAQIDSVGSNETVYLAPFMSWLYKPTERFFHHGFLQVEVAANPSHVHTNAAGRFTADANGDGIFNPADPTDATIAFVTPPLPVIGFGSGLSSAELMPQTLMRLNLGFGYVLQENHRSNWIQRLTGLFEVHYTGTLSDANISQVPLDLFFNGFPVPPDNPIFSDPTFDSLNNLRVGNIANQIHIVNLTTGVSANMGNFVVTHGFTAPVTNGRNRGFDFEYNLQVQRPF